MASFIVNTYVAVAIFKRMNKGRQTGRISWKTLVTIQGYQN